MPECKKYKAEIFWMEAAPTPSNPNPKLSPVNAEPAENGNLLIDFETRKFRVLSGAELKEKQLTTELYINHFATCRNAKEFRRR